MGGNPAQIYDECYSVKATPDGLGFLDSDTAGEMGEENIGFLKLTSPKKEKRKNH
ncbi:uncharacterized protein METZ01_LOCUS266438 [marine metagenome]|uniref:Uncharacterized protein n=1 Tax=marine metagenome TaxID=408172 RepID=A0A382JMB9_9ZZZZ